MASNIWRRPASAVYVPKYQEVLEGTHCLIGGTTGSGKSVVLNGILYTALALYAPCEAKFILIDPKRVELSKYKHLPHVLKYVHSSADTADVLEKTCAIMESRYEQMEKDGVTMYGGSVLFVIIDELADLMISDDSARIKRALQRILQKGRACKIRVIAATQSPARKVIPAELVLNYTHRIALRCLSQIESRQIVNIKGAETINHYGQALYLSPAGFSWLEGLPLVKDEQINERISFWEKQVA